MEAVAAERGFAPDLSELEVSRAGSMAAWLSELRREAFARFEELGFPTAKDEGWRQTGIQPITNTPWVLAKPVSRTVPLPAIDGARAVFINGRFAKNLSRLPEGIRVESMRTALDAEPEAFRAHLARIAAFEQNAFTALNTAFFQDGAVVRIASGAVVPAPIALVFVSAPNGAPAVSHPRILILAAERSQASIVETYAGDSRYFTNAVTEIALSDGAVLEHYKVQRESEAASHVQTIAVRQARATQFTSHNIAFGAAIARTDLHVTLDAEGAECTLNGLFVGDGTQRLDNHTVIDHAKPHCVSRELYKGIMDGASRGVFHGKIIVRPDAQKTDAMQTNKNLLLSRQALVNSTPALEIFADDVKCKHGSTTGQLDAAALFYLRSRGIGQADARALLTYAFAADVAGRIRIPSIRAAVEEELGLRLGGAAGSREAVS
ncbi:MAG TPA: Fe-S cluster assembly protein SufD [Thermoanaerobaculia bacterium]|jgi:Fe-S cluster assembly protein SufD